MADAIWLDPALQLNMVDDDLPSMRSVSSEDISTGRGYCCCTKAGDPKGKNGRQCQLLQVGLFSLSINSRKFTLVIILHEYVLVLVST